MHFEDLIVKKDKSLLKSMGLSQNDVLKFIHDFNKELMKQKFKSKVITNLDDMTKKEERCFCFLAMHGMSNITEGVLSPVNIDFSLN
jgi:hypothetical protein